MFNINNIKLFPPDTSFTEAIEDSILEVCRLDNFDREGFELLPVEQAYYEQSGIGLTFKPVFAKESGDSDGWSAAIVPWITEPDSDLYDSKHIFLDHSYICQAFEPSLSALEQLKSYLNIQPQLAKLIYAKGKYGLDFCVDWIDDDGVFEIIHIEWDFYKIEFEDFVRCKGQFERLIEYMSESDWEHLGKESKKLQLSEEYGADELGDIRWKNMRTLANWDSEYFPSAAFRLRKRL